MQFFEKNSDNLSIYLFDLFLALLLPEESRPEWQAEDPGSVEGKSIEGRIGSGAGPSAGSSDSG